ncbi:MAG: hypothetical protein LBQ68_06585, partial [Clostridiales bacterium]|nr:hypothetical protein [Clostridiales bacterium]
MDNLFCKKNRLTQNKIRLIQKTLIYFSIILLVGIIVFNFYNLFNNKADNNEINEIQVFKQIAVNDLKDSGDDMDLIGCE